MADRQDQDEKNPESEVGQTTAGSGEKASIDFRYRRHLENSSDVAVRIEPGSGHALPMLWENGRWRLMSIRERHRHAELFCSRNPGSYSSRAIESCAKVVVPALENLNKRLKATSRNLIATRNHILEILDDGRVQVLKKDKTIYVPVFVDIELDDHRIVVDPDPRARYPRSFYVPRDNSETESSPLWGSFIRSLFPRDDERQTFQEFFGQPLTQMKTQSIAVLQGEGGRGKSVVLKVLSGLLSGSRTVNLSAVGKYDLGLLLGAPLIVGDEIRGRFNQTLFKQLTGRSEITIERKWEDPFSYKLEGTLMLAWNDPPKIREHSDAIEQRLVVFLCDGEVRRGTDREILNLEHEILEKDKAAVLDWALCGAARVVSRGRLLSKDKLPGRLKRERERLGLATDPIRGFVDDFELSPGGDTGQCYAKDDVYKLMLAWFQTEGRMPQAPMSKDVALKHLRRVLEQRYGVGCLGHELKVSVSFGAKKKRVPVLRLSFGVDVSIQPLNSGDVLRAEQDPASYVDGDVPDHLLQALDKKKKLAALSAEEQEKISEKEMISQGFVREHCDFLGQPVWKKTVDVKGGEA